jgi:CheY-like chemotaxis protein
MTNEKTVDSGLQILIVEDESMVAMMIEDMLEDLGHKVIATSGRMPDASKLVSGARADLAILDVNLNGEETYPLADSLAARAIPFIFATGYGSSGIKADGPASLSCRNRFSPANSPRQSISLYEDNRRPKLAKQLDRISTKGHIVRSQRLLPE